ncbi:MAG TPA: site-specific integrase [Gammaproteobacteria bacterium]|nr:site-specific integrase [Gammaproteobacteria bacterium]
MPIQYIPIPVFDTINEVINQYKLIYADSKPHQIIKQWLNHCFCNVKVTLPKYAIKDYQSVLNFLYSYRGSIDTFSSYRRELERLLQWSWFVRHQSFLKHKRDDIEAFIEFCIKPPKRWIGLKTVARFKNVNGKKQPNLEWRPFDAHVSKKEHKQGIKPNKNNYQFSQQALKMMFGILSSFYNYLLQEETTETNPILLIRQKSKFIRKDNNIKMIRRLSNKQWQTVITLSKEQAKCDESHERTVFILSCLYGMYLRISELVSTQRWNPTMGDFFKDSENNWWFRTVGKGNKARQIAVSHAMLNALKHYREHYLKLPPYPSIDEKTPLIAHAKNINRPITSERPIRQLIQTCFDLAANKLAASGDQHEADLLRDATVHWLRHTGISEDVKLRPREHVRDDAGHSSGAITDRYIDVELLERAKSAKKKQIVKN